MSFGSFRDPFRKRLLNTIHTKHRGNIFSVKFFPSSNESLVASAAADRDIYVYDVNKNACVHELHAHHGRVKRLETCIDSPTLIWSCGEDGYILQHDIRCDPSSTTSLLLNYPRSKLKSSKYLEAKCIAINPIRSEQLAVGANDPYARVYDRRMLGTRSFHGRASQRDRPTVAEVNSDSSRYLLFSDDRISAGQPSNLSLIFQEPCSNTYSRTSTRNRLMPIRLSTTFPVICPKKSKNIAKE